MSSVKYLEKFQRIILISCCFEFGIKKIEWKTFFKICTYSTGNDMLRRTCVIGSLAFVFVEIKNDTSFSEVKLVFF